MALGGEVRGQWGQGIYFSEYSVGNGSVHSRGNRVEGLTFQGSLLDLNMIL